ncbi:MAG: tetratricopeptide repeat protein, partial [Alphaproteobacteria bacterium]|nr:tetratricopeptide repeat protein [Alphaproteobacteria bacterium]
MRRLWSLAALGVLAIAVPAQAQTGTDTRAAYNAAFQDMLNKPQDPATVVRFATLAEQVGDIKGAIAAFERLLLLDPDQPRVNAELAALYLKLGMPDAAKTYADAAIASRRASNETREQARGLLTQANDKLIRSKFSGDLFLGMQYSSNANSGSSGLILSNGAPVVPTPGVSGQPDWGVVGGGLLHHHYDLQTGDHAAIETDLAFYGTQYFSVTSANLGIIDLKSGPRFDFLAGSVDGLT